jgi:hypothetical protein
VDLKASVDLGEDVSDRNSIHLLVTLITLPTPMHIVQIYCTSIYVAF